MRRFRRACLDEATGRGRACPDGQVCQGAGTLGYRCFVPVGVVYPTDCPAGQHCVDFDQIVRGAGQHCIASPDGGDDCNAIRCLTGQRCAEHGMNPGVLTCENAPSGRDI
jgi:hypothetical protein